MSDRASIADRAVDALAAVNRMDYDLTNQDELRHTVRALKRHAEAILIEAFQRAHDLAYTAQDLLRESRKLVAELKIGRDAKEDGNG